MRGADRIVACSRRWPGRRSGCFPDPRHKVTYVHNGLDLAALHGRRRADASLPQPFLLCVCRHVHKKGVDTLLQAFALDSGRRARDVARSRRRRPAAGGAQGAGSDAADRAARRVHGRGGACATCRPFFERVHAVRAAVAGRTVRRRAPGGRVLQESRSSAPASAAFRRSSPTASTACWSSPTIPPSMADADRRPAARPRARRTLGDAAHQTLDRALSVEGPHPRLHRRLRRQPATVARRRRRWARDLWCASVEDRRERRCQVARNARGNDDAQTDSSAILKAFQTGSMG